MDAPDDRQLMARVAAGERQALALLYERHAGFVFRVACRFLGDEEEARDVTQAVFVSLMQSAHRYRPEARLTSWLYRIVANRCLNHRQRASQRLRQDHCLEQVQAPSEQQPDRLVDSAEAAARLRAALLRLPERQRLALVLGPLEGLSYDAIASALGCSKSSVESLLFRARRNLRKVLHD